MILSFDFTFSNELDIISSNPLSIVSLEYCKQDVIFAKQNNVEQ